FSPRPSACPDDAISRSKATAKPPAGSGSREDLSTHNSSSSIPNLRIIPPHGRGTSSQVMVLQPQFKYAKFPKRIAAPGDVVNVGVRQESFEIASTKLPAVSYLGSK